MYAKSANFFRKILSKGKSIFVNTASAENLEQRIGYIFKNKKLLEIALTHLSFTNETGLEYSDSNERLEFLGDAVLDLVVSEFLFKKNLAAREGELTRVKSTLVSRAALARKAAGLSLEKLINFSRESAQDITRGRKSIISNCMEAIIGAAYLDGGLSAASSVIFKTLLEDGQVDLKFDDLQEAKNNLLHYSQVNFQCQPIYRVVDASGPEHAKEFTCEVLIGDRTLGQGSGKNKKDAEKMAAVQTLKLLKKNALAGNLQE